MRNIKEKNKIRLLVVQQFNRAYRIPLLKRLSEYSGIEMTMLYGTNPPVQAGDLGISIGNSNLPFRNFSAPINGIRIKGREILWFPKSIEIIKKETFDVVIADYYTRLLSIWPMQSIQHRKKRGFILWGIGFHQYPTPLIDKIRLIMVKRTDALLLYSDKEKKRYQRLGVPKEKCFVTQNTVDIEGIDAGVALCTTKKINECRKKVGSTEGPVLMHIGRLAKNKRIDLLIKVMPNLKTTWSKIQLVLIGEGPEKNELQRLADELSISRHIHFLGSITDHKLLAPWVLSSDLIVAPAQIGLLAPMAHAYKRTLVISDVPEHRGPELQAFIPGTTGLEYRYQDLKSLERNIIKLLIDRKRCRQYAEEGNSRVRKFMGTERMLNAFLEATKYVVKEKHISL